VLLALALHLQGGIASWTATGTAFAQRTASGSLIRKLEIENAADDAVITSEVEGDRPVGTLTSPEFKIEKRYVAFRIGGGDYERDTCMDLMIRGKVVRSATGRRSDRLIAMSWDVSRHRGQKAVLRIVDRATGDWGHINVDRIEQTDNPEATPVSVGPLYQEKLRPQFHFTARQWTVDHLNPGMRQEGWINDLNGLIYYEGEYHLFAQRWAKCWLHAVSRDLIHWEELEPAFWEEEPESGVQSGTCVIDYENTSGLGKGAMIAFWSRFDNRSQCISYSLDKGRTWKRYDEKNPIFIHPERDPKVFWYAPGKHWVMIMYGDGQYHILNSPDLLHWTDQHHPIPDSFECPDFFELPIDGNKDDKKWVLIQGNGQYSIGTFDGHEFKEETGRLPCDVGPNFYATQSWANTETGDGRRIQAAWMRGSDFPEMPFSQQVSLPCELTLHRLPGGLRIFRKPISELEKLQGAKKDWPAQTLVEDEPLVLASQGDLYRLKLNVKIPAGAQLNVTFGPTALGFRTNSVEGHPIESEVQSIDILIDRGSVEAYVNEGQVSWTQFALNKNGVRLFSTGGPIELKSIELYPLKSIWPK